MTDQARSGGPRTVSPQRERVSALLARYPDLSDDETAEVLQFLRKGRHLEVGLLTSNLSLRPNLDAFMDRHRAHFRVTWKEVAALITAIAGLPILLWVIVEALG
jgi:hypothetical protein